MVAKRIALIIAVAVVAGVVVALVMNLLGLGRSAGLVGGVTAAVLGGLSYGAMNARRLG